MKICRILAMPMLALLIISCPNSDMPHEEKITITIERPSKSPEQPARPQNKTAVPSANETKKQPVETAPVAPSPKHLQTDKEPDITSDFITTADNLNIKKHSKVEIRDFWRSVRDTTVTWKGTVHTVRKGRRGFKLLIHNPVCESRKGFNVVLAGKGQDDIISNVSKDNVIQFKGKLTKFSKGTDEYCAIIVLREAEIIKLIK